MTKCYHCGAEVAQSSKFCTVCGAEQGFTAEMIQKAMDGDDEAISSLYERTYNGVYYTVLALIKHDEDTVMDLVQDTYVKAFQSLGQLQQPERFKAWVNRIAINKTKDYLKKEKMILFSELSAGENEDLPELEFEDGDLTHLPDQVLDQRETTRLVNEILDTLSHEQRLVVGMYYYREMSVAEIADMLECSENTVKSRLHYARKKIKTKVEKLEREGTKLYNLAPIPFLVWLLRCRDAYPVQPGTGMVCHPAGSSTVQRNTAHNSIEAAKGTTHTATNGVIKTAVTTTSKSVAVKATAAVLAALIAVGGGVTTGVAFGNRHNAAKVSDSVPQEEPVDESEEPAAEEEQALASMEPQIMYEDVLDEYYEYMALSSAEKEQLEMVDNNDVWYPERYPDLIPMEKAFDQTAYYYAFYDLNGDGIEELLVTPDQSFYACGNIYTFDGEQAIPLHNAGTFSVEESGEMQPAYISCAMEPDLFYIGQNGEIVLTHTYEDGTIYTFGVKEGGEGFELTGKYDDGDWETYDYYVDGQIISSDTLWKQIEERTGGLTKLYECSEIEWHSIEQTYTGAAEAYKEKLTEYFGENPWSDELWNYGDYALYDFMGDSTPELIMHACDNSAVQKVYFYTFSGGDIEELGALDTDHASLWLDSDGNVIVSCTQMSVECDNKVIYQDGKLKSEVVREYQVDNAEQYWDGLTQLETEDVSNISYVDEKLSER